MYEYTTTVLSVYDGDTIHVLTDLGFDLTMRHTLRFAGINCPEMPTPEGVAAKEYVGRALSPVGVPLSPPVRIRTSRDRREKFGRFLAWVILPDGSCLNRLLVDTGNAVPYGNLPVDAPA